MTNLSNLFVNIWNIGIPQNFSVEVLRFIIVYKTTEYNTNFASQEWPKIYFKISVFHIFFY